MSTFTKLEKVINISMSGKWYHDIIVGAESWLIKRNLRLCAAIPPPKQVVRPHHLYALQDYIGRWQVSV
jgi:hypothetical protein